MKRFVGSAASPLPIIKGLAWNGQVDISSEAFSAILEVIHDTDLTQDVINTADNQHSHALASLRAKLSNLLCGIK
eukprot:5844709-Heterocapsa_arctica.AAC.1